MRKMRDSSKTSCSVLLRACAEARSRPNGFSTTTRASRAEPDRPSPLTTVSNRLGGEIVQWALRGAELSAQSLHRGRMTVVALHVVKPLAEPREDRLVEASGALDALPHAGAEVLERPARSRDADDRHLEMAAPHHGLEGREDLLVGEIATRPEDDERVGARRAHVPGPF